MRLIIVSGRSGSGKSTALDVLEDNGFYCIDNLPAGLLPELAERALLRVLDREADTREGLPELVLLRASSVQGRGRSTTQRLARFAATPLSSVAGDGTAHTPVTSSEALAELVASLGTFKGQLPRIVLQPWEGATTASILREQVST